MLFLKLLMKIWEVGAAGDCFEVKSSKAEKLPFFFFAFSLKLTQKHTPSVWPGPLSGALYRTLCQGELRCLRKK